MSKLKTSRCCTQTRQQISQSACYCSCLCQPTHSASFFTDNLCPLLAASIHLRTPDRTLLTCPLSMCPLRLLRRHTNLAANSWRLGIFAFGLLGKIGRIILLFCCAAWFSSAEFEIHSCMHLQLTFLIWNKVEAVLSYMHLIKRNWQNIKPLTLGLAFALNHIILINWELRQLGCVCCSPPIYPQFSNLEDASVIMCW